MEQPAGYTLASARRELGIQNPRTLDKWMRKLKIKATQDEFDRRFWVISVADVERIRVARAQMPATTPRAPRARPRVSPTVPPPLLPPVDAVVRPLRSSKGSAPRTPLPAGYISVSRYLDHHSQDKDHPLQLRNILRATAEGHIPPSESPPEGVDWRSDVNQRVQHAYSEEAHLAVSCYAAETWPDLYQSCDICRAAVEAEAGRVETLAGVLVTEKGDA